jgi:hypothetical protein
MFNVSPFASLAEVNRMLSAWGIEATGTRQRAVVSKTPA